MSSVRPEKLRSPYAIIRVDTDSFAAANPDWAITVVALFDNEQSASEEVVRLLNLNAEKGCTYFKQRVKKYYRSHDPGS